MRDSYAAAWEEWENSEEDDFWRRNLVAANGDEINEGIRASLSRLDGTRAAVVSEVSGMSRAELAELGGVPEN